MKMTSLKAGLHSQRKRFLQNEWVSLHICGQRRRRPFNDGVPADKAPLGYTDDVAVRADGSVLIADWLNCAIRIVDPEGKIHKFAGNGGVGYTGDGGPAINAEIGYPNTVAVGPDNSAYLIDRYTQRVRRVDPAGNISTFAGQSTSGFTSDGGPAKNAEFSYPVNVAVAPDGSVFVADTANRRIRKIDAKTNIISTYAGGGPWVTPQPEGILAQDAHLNNPRAVNINSNGTLLVTDYWDNKIRFLTPTIKTPGGGTP